MYFREAAIEFNKILEEEDICLQDSFKTNFLNIMSEMCNYSEEDHKIRPQVILGTNLHLYFDTITPKSYIVMYEDGLSGEQLPRYFKSLALFCDNGWYIVVNVNENNLEYGIFRRYTNIDGERFEDYFQGSFIPDGHMVMLKAINNFEIAITRKEKEDQIISQKFVYNENKESGYETNFSKLADDIVENCVPVDQPYLKRCLLKVIRNFPLKIHGTILLVVDDSYCLQNQGLSGIEIKPPIDFNNIFLQYKKVEQYSEAENVYSLTGALYEMLNTDGITIISNKGRVLYYNVFYEGKIPKNIKGGARKRTALGILENNELEGIIGIYFQSQDGDIFYKRKKEV